MSIENEIAVIPKTKKNQKNNKSSNQLMSNPSENST